MEASITKDDWAAQVAKAVEHERMLREHTVQLRKVDLALFGDAEIPETVRISLTATMMRLNTWLDMIGKMGRLVGAGVLGFASLAYTAHALGWI